MFEAPLSKFDYVLFKLLQIKNIPRRHFQSVHLRHEWAWPKSAGCKVVSFVISFACFKHILPHKICKESLLPLVEEEIR